eukprot:9062465-Pyramimonas_sp.AAC.1
MRSRACKPRPSARRPGSPPGGQVEHASEFADLGAASRAGSMPSGVWQWSPRTCQGTTSPAASG